jgi:hypothetical protein
LYRVSGMHHRGSKIANVHEDEQSLTFPSALV